MCGFFSTFEKYPSTLRSRQIQCTAPISPAEKVNTSKTLFDMAFTKNTWLVQPSTLAF
jgi:hypothetical protein